MRSPGFATRRRSIRDGGRSIRDGASPSPTSGRRPSPHPVGATLVVARIRDAEAFDSRRGGVNSRRDKPVPHERSPSVSASRRGDPCGRPKNARRSCRPGSSRAAVRHRPRQWTTDPAMDAWIGCHGSAFLLRTRSTGKGGYPCSATLIERSPCLAVVPRRGAFAGPGVVFGKGRAMPSGTPLVVAAKIATKRCQPGEA